ncbi:uncharacterized protein LOC123505576 [Portunus trituberculatus]|uniref:uncharacterized protein LOC123505576 n=1 Tax=Portunus trituberculatus TaxID=210409 RepID=UPI001E1D1EC3|nr:uncharacterized protein LOC123505576 [Portunus trituberculatus]
MGESGGAGGGGEWGKPIMGLLGLLDSLLSIFVFAPLVVFYWRGCWQLMDTYLFPENQLYSTFTSLGIGVLSGLLFCLIQGPLASLCDHSRRPILHLLISRFYTLIYCVCVVNHWRGVWNVWDFYTGTSWQSGATSFGIGLLALALTRGLKNILAPPFLVVPDHPVGYFSVPTLFQAEKERCGYFLLDTVFTVVVTGSLVVFVWRGAWVFLDAMLFPTQIIYSAWGSMAVGMTVTMLSFLAQLMIVPCFRHIHKGLGKILIEDSYHTICFLGCVNVWRGVWFLLNIYLMPELQTVSNFLTAVAGQIVLMCFYTANSILVRGAVMDGAYEGAKGIIFPTHYLRFFYKNKKLEEQERSNMWMQAEGGQKIPGISAPLEATVVGKANGVYDMRGYGDGHSFSGGYTDAYNNMAGEEGRVGPANTTFQSQGASEARPVPTSASSAAGRTYHGEDQSETHF